MSKSNDEREFRLRPGKPKVPRTSESQAWSSPFKMLMHYARQSRGAKGSSGSFGGRPSRPYRQRCAVRITYSKNAMRGQWRAHGRYLERESAAGAERIDGTEMTKSGISSQLQAWQAERDELLWKIIISLGDHLKPGHT